MYLPTASRYLEEYVESSECVHVSMKQQRQLATNSERTLMGCAVEGGSAHPISVLELTKNEVDESSIYFTNVQLYGQPIFLSVHAGFCWQYGSSSNILQSLSQLVLSTSQEAFAVGPRNENLSWQRENTFNWDSGNKGTFISGINLVHSVQRIVYSTWCRQLCVAVCMYTLQCLLALESASNGSCIFKKVTSRTGIVSYNIHISIFFGCFIVATTARRVRTVPLPPGQMGRNTGKIQGIFFKKKQPFLK